jgi:beta-methylarginine biosynthesis bifunctional aminotransferase
VIPPETISRLVDACVRRGCAVVADLVYDDFVLSDAIVRHPLAATEHWEHVFVVNSVSKNYGAPGLRVGWVTSHPRNVSALTALLERECIAVSATSQLGALDLLRHGNADLRATVERGERLVHELASRLPQLALSRPPAGTQCLLSLVRRDVSRFADHMLRRHRVLVATSEGYEGCPVGHVRIPYGYPEAVIRPALELIARGVDERDDLGAPSSELPLHESERPLTSG